MTSIDATAATGEVATTRPLDARLARRLIKPLIDTRLRPSHVTGLRAVLGLTACGLFAIGGYVAMNLGALMFIVSNFIDHADGELARATGDYTRFGHVFDLIADWVMHTLFFVGLGAGLTTASGGIWPLWLGVFCAAMVALTFALHEIMALDLGRRGARLPALAWFEIEDVMYLFPLVTLGSLGLAFLSLSAIGLPCFIAWLAGNFAQRRLGRYKA